MVEKSAERIYQRFLKDLEYEKECTEALNKTLNRGYARKLIPEEIGKLIDEYDRLFRLASTRNKLLRRNFA